MKDTEFLEESEKHLKLMQKLASLDQNLESTKLRQEKFKELLLTGDLEQIKKEIIC